jgi:predicted DNA-binding protein YlxM (UPF0122 family)
MKPKKLKNLYWETHPGWDSKFKEFEDEEFKPIQGYEGHYVLLITLSLPKSCKTYRIHRLVYTHFVGDVKFHQKVIHKDKNRSNNYYKNLEVMNWSESSKDTGSKKRKQGETDTLNRSCILQFTREGEFVRQYSSADEAVKVLGISSKALDRCLNGDQKTAGGYQWRYRVDTNFDDRIFNIPPMTIRKDANGKIVYQFGLDGTFIRAYPSMSEAARKMSVPRNRIYYYIKKKSISSAGYQWRRASDPLFKNGIVNIPPGKKIRFGFQPVVQYNLEGKFVREYASVKEAVEISGVHISAIWLCVRRRIKRVGQYQWRLKKDVIEDGEIRDVEPVKKKPYSQAVCQFGLDGKFIREYPTITEAAKKMGVSNSGIHMCIRKINSIKTIAGYQWRAKEEVVKDGKIMDIEPFKRFSSKYFEAVCQFARDGTFIRQYPSIIKAAEKTNLNKYYIFCCTIKKQKITGGFQWRAKEEVVKDGLIMDIEPIKRFSSKNLEAVCQFARDGTFIRQYPSIIEAAEKTNIKKYKIFFCTIKKQKMTGGFQWRFRNDPIFKNGIVDIPPFIMNFRKPHIFQFDLYGRFIRSYPTAAAAARSEGILAQCIRNALRRYTLTAGGYQWRYNSDPEINNLTKTIAAVFKK